MLRLVVGTYRPALKTPASGLSWRTGAKPLWGSWTQARRALPFQPAGFNGGHDLAESQISTKTLVMVEVWKPSKYRQNVHTIVGRVVATPSKL